MAGLTALFNRLGPIRVMALVGVAIGMVLFFLLFADRMTRQDMTVLYNDLDVSDATGITQKLESMGIPHDIASDGSAVMVPRKEAARLRMAMAEAGLPTGGNVGYEIFDKSSGLGTTSFTQKINQIRALEGELARSIRTLGVVKSARVHLVLPKREVFSRETQAPSASIVLILRGTASLGDNQVSAIQHLVAAAVPKLAPTRVSVVDSRGNLLARGTEEDHKGDTVSAADTASLREDYEKRMSSAIERLLERSIGYGNVRAEVSADMDFDRITTNTEEFDPEGQVLRSSQTITDISNSSDGNESNAVSVSQNLPDADTTQGGNKSENKAERTEETNNFEISKTIRTHIRESGIVRRVTVAVMVDGVYTKNDDDEWIYSERDQAELDKIASLVRSAVG